MSDITNFAPISGMDPRLARQGWGTVQHGADKALWVEFHTIPVFMGFKSQNAGYPVYEDRVYCSITIPSSSGTIKSVQDEEANDSHKRRFPQQWAAFEQGKKVSEVGLPVERWPVLESAMVATCKHVGIHTVEQLAALTDGMIGSLGPTGRKLREQARTWLDDADKNAVAQRLASQNADLQAQIDELRKIVDQQAVTDTKAQQQEPAGEPAPAKRRA